MNSYISSERDGIGIEPLESRFSGLLAEASSLAQVIYRTIAVSGSYKAQVSVTQEHQRTLPYPGGSIYMWASMLGLAFPDVEELLSRGNPLESKQNVGI